MKSKEEIEELGFLKYPRFITDPYHPMEDDNTYERKIWIDAYTQCQEDMAKEFEKDGAKLFKSEIRRAYMHGQGNGQMMGAGLERDEIDDYTNWRMRTLNNQD